MLKVTCTLIGLLSLTTVYPSNGLLLDDSYSAQNRILVLESEVAALKTAVSGLLNSQQSECSVVCPKSVHVAFMASLSADLVNAATGHVIVFDNVITNVGNAYNHVHGNFTAPVNGTYYFSLVASSPPTGDAHALHIDLKKNNVLAGFVFMDGKADYWFRRSTNAILHLDKGDEVWAEIHAVAGQHILGSCAFCTHFSGFLIDN